jgi:hypothetical protein
MSEGNLRARFTSNVGKVTAPAGELREHLQAAPSNQLLLAAVHVTRGYLGGTVPGFPNLFVNDGPNTGVATGGAGHNFMTETVDHFIFECLQLMVEGKATSIEVTQEAHDAHNERIEEAIAGLIWTHEHGADTYYRNQAGRIILPSPFPPEVYWEMSQIPEASSFVLRMPASLEGTGR